MTGRTALAVAAGLLLVGLASALPYGHYKSPPPGTRDAAGFWDDYGGYYGGYPGYYGRYDDYYPLPGRGYDDLYYGGRGYGALGGEDNSIYNSEYPSYYNSFCNCNGNARCMIECESSHSYKFSS